MRKEKQKSLWIALGLLIAFVVWTVAIKFVDVQAIGPQESTVGFATINRFIHNLTGVNMLLYTITDWLGLVPLCFIMGFGILGLCEWIKRKNLLKVDFDILALGGFYIVVMVFFLFFEKVIVNYRPVLIDGCLEPSYPSSTTLLVMCVMPTAMMQLNIRIKNKGCRIAVDCVIVAFVAFMIIGRLVSGVHWFSDIIGGALLSIGLVMMYGAIATIGDKMRN